MDFINGSKFKGFPNAAAEFVYTRSYARWIPNKKRRESYPETVARLIYFLKSQPRFSSKISSKQWHLLYQQIISLNVMPSMRLLWTAGPAAQQNNIAIYNCAFLKVNSPESFAELFHILLCGTGVGFSCRSVDVNHLPQVPPTFERVSQLCLVEDSRQGWATSIDQLIHSLFRGKVLKFNYGAIRPAGAVLETMGGRAAGYEPLEKLHEVITEFFYRARGRQLYSLEVHDIICHIASTVVAGGVRRSSLISLSDLFDENLRNAKVGNKFPFVRAMANNSVMYIDKPSYHDFCAEWAILENSGTGERGIFNREAARKHAPKRRFSELIEGINPCGEICLRDRSFCNLSEVVIRPNDSLSTLMKKVEVATLLGVMQSTFVDFKGISEIWKKNAREERLLGVSLTGICDNYSLINSSNLRALKEVALNSAFAFAKHLNINPPAAVTCIKPSGTVSQLCYCSSGAHPSYAQYYLRRFRISATDPLCRMLRSQGFILEPEVGQSFDDWQKASGIYKQSLDLVAAKAQCPIFDKSHWKPSKVNTFVISFPIAAPKGALTRDSMSAIEQLELYQRLVSYYTEHNVSMTVYVRDHEWHQVKEWVYSHWEDIIGVSFLSYTNKTYRLAPYEQLDVKNFERLMQHWSQPDYSQLFHFESIDSNTNGGGDGCTSDDCEHS